MSASTPLHAEASGSASRSPDRSAIVTGATGFIGRYVCRALLERGWHVRGTVRTAERASDLVAGVEPVQWDLTTADRPLLALDTSAVIHLAGLAHVMGAAARDAEQRYRLANVEATRRLISAARSARVRRFVYVSSVKVLGEGERSPYACDAVPDPQDAYARSKADAESIVRADSGEMQWTSVRPAFVYGASGKGNAVRLFNLARIASRFPLPLASLRNRRSMVYVENLADLLAFCIEHDVTAGLVLPGVDRQSVSTPDLLRAVAASQGASAHLFPFPTALLSLVARTAGRSQDWARLAGSFEVDTSILRSVGWQPPVSFEESFRRSAAPTSAAVDA